MRSWRTSAVRWNWSARTSVSARIVRSCPSCNDSRNGNMMDWKSGTATVEISQVYAAINVGKFRSGRGETGESKSHRDGFGNLLDVVDRPEFLKHGRRARPVAVANGDVDGGVDRKSTRLNSSH